MGLAHRAEVWKGKIAQWFWSKCFLYINTFLLSNAALC